MMTRWLERSLLVLLVSMPTIAYADAAAGATKAQLCLFCHKPNNPAAYVPTLEGQTREYLVIQIKAYRDKRRPDPFMQTNVASLSDTDIRDLADYFSAQPPVRAVYVLDAAKVARGRSRARELNCGTCHRSDFSGDKEVPRLAGLDPRYGRIQIADFISTKRPHPPVPGLRDLSREDAEALAQFFANLD